MNSTVSNEGTPSTAPHGSVMRSAGIMSAAVGLSRVSGLVREMVMTRLFGAGMFYDAFLLAFRIPNLTRDLFAEGALSSAFVPKFTEYLTNRSREDAARLARLVATALILIVGSGCALGAWFAPELVSIFAPGFRGVPGKFELAVKLTRIMFPFLLLVALAAQAMGVLNALNQFAIPALSSTFFNLGSVGFGLLLGWTLGPSLGMMPIEAMAWGVVLGGALQLIVQVPSLAKAGFPFRPEFDRHEPGLRHILKLMGPAILGNAAVQINVMVNTSFAAGVFDPVRGLNGPVSWLNCAFRFLQLPLGLFGVAIASATLPAISRSAAVGQMDEFRQTLARSLGLVFLLTVPSAVGLAILGPSMIGLVYEGGRFNSYDTDRTADALAAFAIGLAGYSAIKVLTPAFYALKDSRTPMMVSLSNVLVNYVTAATLIKTMGMGHEGLAVTTSVVAMFGFLSLFWILRNRMGGIHGRDLLSSVLRILIAASVMAIAIYASHWAIWSWLGRGKLGCLIDVAVSIPLGAVAFWSACHLLKIPELAMAMRSMQGLFRRFGLAR